MSFNEKSSTAFRRRLLNYVFIYPVFQLKLVLVNLIILICGFIVLILQNFYLFSKLHQMGNDAGMSKDHAFHQFIQFQQEQFVFFASITMAVVLFLISAASILLSHRIAGPIVRLQQYFVRIIETGEISKLEFRKNDFFDDLPTIANKALESLKENNSGGGR